MVGEVFFGLMGFLSFLVANLAVGTILNATGIDLTSIINQALGVAS